MIPNGSTGFGATAGQVLDTANSYTVSVWVRLTSTSGPHHTVLSQDGANISAFFLKHPDESGINKWRFVTEGSDATPAASDELATATNTAVAGEWTHVAGVYDDPGNTINVYVNGVLEESVASTSSSRRRAASSSAGRRRSTSTAPAGQIRSGARGVAITIVSANTYNDAAWHHVVATLGAAGMNLYVDGASVTPANTGVTTARTVANGCWRWGGTNLTGFTNQPAGDYFIGSIDDVAYYVTELSPIQVARHYTANH